jgi:hypothetical protein
VRLRASHGTIAESGQGWAGYFISRITQGFLIAGLSWAFFWLVWIYASGLRDPRYLDGWVLTGAMIFQVLFHIARKIGLSPKSDARWRKLHVFAGYLIVAAFISHSDFTLPDTGFEWALWTGTVLVTLSGILGIYLQWSQHAKLKIGEGVSYNRIPALRAELEREFLITVAETNPRAAAIDLPGLPYDAWIKELCATHLKDFFKGHHNFTAHLIGSQRPLKRLTDTIDSLSRYVDQQSQTKLATIRNLVVEKDRLDFAQVSLGLSRGWLFIHVPVTYTLIVLTVLHIVVVYAFTLGVW